MVPRFTIIPLRFAFFMKHRKRRRDQRPFPGFVIHEIDPHTGARSGAPLAEILTDSESHEAGRERAKDKLFELLDTYPGMSASYTEYDAAGRVVE